MELDKKLYEASFEGNVTLFQKLIREDPLILDRISPTVFNETYLHVAILRDHAPFVREVLSYNPKLVSATDWLGHTPLHLASSKGNVEIVRDLLLVGGASSALAVSKDGKLPLHLAIMKGGGRVEVVEELVKACRESIRCRVDGGDMGLHLCVRFDNLDALKVILKENDIDLLNARNDDGNTCLHLATLYKNFKIVKYLLSRPGINLNARNNNGLTPLELIENSPRDIKTLEILNVLLQSNPQRSNSLPPLKSHSPLNPLAKINTEVRSRQRSKPSWKKFFTFDNTNLEQHRGIILITATILAAASALPIITMRVNGPDLTDDYSTFAITFVPVSAIMVLLVSGFSLKNKLCIWLIIQLMYTSIGFLALNFIGSMLSKYEARSSNIDWITIISALIFFGLLLMVSALNLIRLIVWVVTCIKGCVKRRKLRTRRPTNNNALSNA